MPFTLFYSYAHKDEAFRSELEKHLSQLRREGLISEWHDRMILPGEMWSQEIDRYLETASLILLLVSPDFLASDYCYEIEMQRALERHKRNEARVIPIILRECDWRHTPLKDLQCLPRDGKPVVSWPDQDAIFTTITQSIRKVIELQQVPAQPPVPISALNRQNRIRMLKQIRTIWVDGLLTQSLHHATEIELSLQNRPDMLANPWRLQVQELYQAPRPLPDGTTIAQVYEQTDSELLILGEPGAGKTTLLLELTRTLLDQAEKDEQLQIPVVFNLSSWAEKRQRLNSWMVEELWSKYQVPRKIGQDWIASDQVLPLLDGLDEVAKDAQVACVEAINAYYQAQLEKRGGCPLVVCCRSQEYAALSTRVTLPHAISILPLTDEQIHLYLERAGEQTQVLKQALYEDRELHSLARQPLMLNIFLLTYQGVSVADVPMGKTRAEMQRLIFARYVERMFRRGKPSERWKPAQVRHWLTFLATQMQQQNQTVFLVENLQPAWLSIGQRLLYQCCLGIIRGLVFGLLGGLLGGLVILLLNAQFGDLYIGSLVGILVGLLAGLVGKAARARIRGLDTGLATARVLSWSWKKAQTGVTFGWIIAPFGGLIVGLVGGIARGLAFGVVAGLEFVLAVGLAATLVFGLLFGAAFGLLEGLGTGLVGELVRQVDTKVVPAEALTWSWRKTLLGLLLGLVAGLVFGLVAGLVGVLAGKLVTGLVAGPVFGVVVGLLVGLVGVLVLGLTFGISGRQLPERLSLSPNEGIWRSGKNGLIGGLVGVMVIGLIVGLVVTVAKDLLFGVVAGLAGGLIVGLLGGQVVGLEAFEKHFLLRFFLSLFHNLPWDLISFLNEDVRLLLLRKVGGSYIFVHRLLLDYFAESGKEGSAS